MTTLLAKVRLLLPVFGGTKWAFVLGGIGAAIASFCEAGVMWLMVPLVDRNFKNVPGAGMFDVLHPPLWLIPITLIALFVVRGLAGFVTDYTLAWAANHAMLKLRLQLFSRVLDAHPRLFGMRSASSLTNTVVYEVLAGVSSLVGAAQTVLKDSFTVISLLGWMLWMNWQLTLFMAAIVPAVALTMRLYGKRMHRITSQSQVAVDQLGYIVEENVMAWRMVRLHGVQSVQNQRFDQASRALRRLVMKSTVASATVTPITQILTALAIASVIAVALWQTRGSEAGMGTFVAFITAAIAVAQPLRRLTDVSTAATRGFVAVERGLELIHETPLEIGGTYRPESGRARGAFTLRGVRLHYGALDASAPAPAALDAVDLDIPAGQTVALVGPSGAGKTSLVNLLPRFIDPTDGTLALDGTPLPEWDLQALRAQFALVSQDVVLFNDSIAANVSFGAPADPTRIRAALDAANLGAFVDSLPQGMDAMIGHNGTQLSGGQRQRLAIARAIYKDAPVLILDEATSALDSESERLVQQALERLLQGRTSIVIAHRLSTIERADRIVAMQAGRVVEQGTHAELIAHGGLYARLHALQFRGATP